jgi:hypothetical protein
MNSKGGVLYSLAKKGEKSIYNYVKTLLQEGRVEQAYSFVRSIRGVGSKITSLYLRDVAYLELDSAKHDHYLLQPIDTWLDQVIEIILNHTGEKSPTKTSDKQKLIVELCREAHCSPIDFNQGAWFAGSILAQDYGTFKNVIEDREKAKVRIQQRIKEREEVIDAMKRWLKDNA